MSFASLGLSPKVLAAVEATGYTQPTPIQSQAIPHVLARRDVLGIAQTGTGKTASFVLPMLTRLETGRARARMPRTLILEPTRELAAQVEESFNRYGLNQRVSVALIIGGVSFDEQEKKLDRGVDVLIATPGRLLDHFGRGKLLLTGVDILVIDEADRMLDMGFIPDIERITKLIPFTRQTLLFSATMPPEIQRLADLFMTNPERVEVSRPASVTKTVTQLWVSVDREAAQKRAALRELIRGATDLTNAIIFCNRKRDVAVLARSLQKHGFDADALHGDMDQRSRTMVLDKFRRKELTLLIASDVAARGLDIPAVSHVFNFDVPSHAEDYVHRIGRTGRAGRSGTSITLAAPQDGKYVAAIEKLTGESVSMTKSTAVVEHTGEADEAPRRGRGAEGSSDRSRRSRGGRGGDRPVPRHEHEAPTTPFRAAPERAPPAAPAAAPIEAPPARAPRAERPARPPREPAPARAAQPAAAPQRPPEDRRPDPSRRPGNDAPQRGRGNRQERDNEPSVVGMGDHVPQFMLRPVRLPSS
ncbi:MAG: DEAD/DEAH box helicase [Bauldia sp.]|nr:DEAD/DEAH box helicase [Bauldia sp.]MCW5716716.1 DEAD/DEAH box helicase [Bauldia sp.]